jgi:predicted esterase
VKKTLKVLIAVVLVIVIAFGGYMLSGQQKPMPQALEAMKSDDKVTVTNGSYIAFKPNNIQTEKALIIYPGGKVDPRAYAPMAKAFADNGVAAFIVKMPFNLAIFGYNKADKVISENGNLKEWYIAGHSLGGVMAARYAYGHQDSLKGLILWAAYPEDSKDLSKSAMPVMSIYGTNDNLAQPSKISETQHLLPSSVQYISLKGGNHSQFGWYGFQKGDNQADITREEQQKEIVDSTLELINPNSVWKLQDVQELD